MPECKLYQKVFDDPICVHWFDFLKHGFNCRHRMTRLCAGYGKYIPNIIKRDEE
jgi:hypothetical protein